jgi:Uma2 family endonuclease
MTIPAPRHQYAYQDYVRFEATANVKHEYFSGEIYAIAGGTPEHVAVVAKVIALLEKQFHGGSFRVYSSDLRVRVVETGLATYPDVTVVCGPIEADIEDHDAVTNPALLVEVLSPSSEEYDRGGKLLHYRLIPSLREVLLVSYRENSLEVHRRETDGTWSMQRLGAGQVAELASINATLAVDELYLNEPGGSYSP